MSKYATLVIGDFHIKDCQNSHLDTWQYKTYVHSFKNIARIIEKHSIKRLILLGDTFDTVPKHNSLELFAMFMQIIKGYVLEIILLAGNHTLMSGQGRYYYEEIMKDYFKLNYNINVLEYEQIGDILYCSHKYINKLEKLNKPIKLVYSHLRCNIFPTSDEIDLTALYNKAELVILGDIHHRNQHKNIVYSGCPIDTHFDSSNELDNHTPSVLLLNEGTLESKWATTLSTQYRKKKKVYSSVASFLSDVENLREDFKKNHNFYKVVVQDVKASLNTIKKSLYEEFCIMSLEALDLEYNYENRKIATDIVKNLSTTDTSKSLLEFCMKNLTRADLKDKLINRYHKYEAIQQGDK